MISFVNAFLSYLLVLLVFVAVGGGAVFLGIFLRKRKNAQESTGADAEMIE